MTAQRIEINPATRMGMPIIRITPTTAEIVLRNLADGLLCKPASVSDPRT